MNTTHKLILQTLIDYGVKNIDLYQALCQIIPESMQQISPFVLPEEGSIDHIPNGQDPQYNDWSSAVLLSATPADPTRSKPVAICSLTLEDVAKMNSYQRRKTAEACIRLMVDHFSMNYMEIGEMINAHNTTVGVWYRGKANISAKYHRIIVKTALALCKQHSLSPNTSDTHEKQYR